MKLLKFYVNPTNFSLLFKSWLASTRFTFYLFLWYLWNIYWFTPSIFAFYICFILLWSYYRFTPSIFTFCIIFIWFLTKMSGICRCTLSNRAFSSNFRNSTNDWCMHKASVIMYVSNAMVITISNEYFDVLLIFVPYRIDSTWFV